MKGTQTWTCRNFRRGLTGRNQQNPYATGYTLIHVANSSPASGSTVREMPPRGFYDAAEVGRLAGVSGTTIGQWGRWDYIQASQGSDAFPYRYSYQDIGEAMIVHALVIQGVPRKEIREAIKALRDAYGYNWPLTHADLIVTDYGEREGRREVRGLVVREGADTYFDLTQHKYSWQHVIDPQSVATVALELNRGGWAAREMPDLQHIEVDPDRLSGRPVIRGTRVFAEQAAKMALADQRIALKDGYELADDQINDAVRWFNRVLEYEAA